MSSISDFFRGSEVHALSGADIMDFVDGKTRVLAYESLGHYDSLEQILSPHGSAIVLYQTAPRQGHWVALIRRSNHTLEFYDSYGFRPDEELKFDNSFHLKIHGGRLTPHLTRLIQDGGWRVIYNKCKLQKNLDDINTCGRYAALRVKWKHIPMKQFNDLLLKNKHFNPDFWVSALTYIQTCPAPYTPNNFPSKK